MGHHRDVARGGTIRLPESDRIADRAAHDDHVVRHPVDAVFFRPAVRARKSGIARPVGSENADPLVAELEQELTGLLNETGIGPMGLGGDVTVLQCHIEHADTHMTLNPVAVNYQCWAARRASAHVAADGTVDFDREA